MGAEEGRWIRKTGNEACLSTLPRRLNPILPAFIGLLCSCFLFVWSNQENLEIFFRTWAVVFFAAYLPQVCFGTAYYKFLLGLIAGSPCEPWTKILLCEKCQICQTEETPCCPDCQGELHPVEQYNWVWSDKNLTRKGLDAL